MQIVHSQDLSKLSLNAALQFDLLERSKDANLDVIGAFASSLMNPNGSQAGINALGLSASPLSVEIFNSAVNRVDEVRAEDLAGLQDKVSKLVNSIQKVSAGLEKDQKVVGFLKRFSLALHQTLLNEAAPFKQDHDWLSSKDNSFA